MVGGVGQKREVGKIEVRAGSRLLVRHRAMKAGRRGMLAALGTFAGVLVPVCTTRGGGQLNTSASVVAMLRIDFPWNFRSVSGWPCSKHSSP